VLTHLVWYNQTRKKLVILPGHLVQDPVSQNQWEVNQLQSSWKRSEKMAICVSQQCEIVFLSRLVMTWRDSCNQVILLLVFFVWCVWWGCNPGQVLYHWAHPSPPVDTKKFLMLFLDFKYCFWGKMKKFF
jgi:hypothetical protein